MKITLSRNFSQAIAKLYNAGLKREAQQLSSFRNSKGGIASWNNFVDKEMPHLIPVIWD